MFESVRKLALSVNLYKYHSLSIDEIFLVLQFMEVEISVLLLYFKITSFQMKESESDDTANCFQSFGFRITLPPPNLCPQRPPCDPEVSAVYECWKFLILDGNNVKCKIKSESI